MKLWSGRFGKETDALVNDFNASIQFDQRLYREDITGSLAHANMARAPNYTARRARSTLTSPAASA